MLPHYLRQIVLSGFLCLVFVCPAMAKAEQVFDTFTLYYENDFLAGTDRDYTSGLKLTWSTPYTSDAQTAGWPSWIYPLSDRLPLVHDSGQQRAVSLSIGQEIYTPEDIHNPDLILDDRPYAGRTYVAVGIHGKTVLRQSTWELNVGILGPASLAEHAQRLVHTINGANDPEGWNNQLNNELTVDAIFESRWKVKPPGVQQGFSYDFIPHLGVRVGTVNVYANAGGEFRLGWEMPEDFGTCPIRAGCEVNSAFEKNGNEKKRREKLSWHVFTALDVRLVLWDIYLDGNVFSDSHSVDKKPFVADSIVGLALHYGRVEASYSYIYRTRQFETQSDGQAFSSLSISWLF
ncbi:MAG TPA: lipid A deacylase LpxR family protein [Geopsychrobacteraceae bacterium]|nr:lipid A deacylase LpxR family protein [Geopsychrobacteraceae bacterium]